MIVIGKVNKSLLLKYETPFRSVFLLRPFCRSEGHAEIPTELRITYCILKLSFTRVGILSALTQQLRLNQCIIAHLTF